MRYQRGTTLIELMVALGVLAIILSMAAPSFRNVLIDNRITTWSNELISGLNYARSEAVRRGDTVRVVPDGGGYRAGWRIPNPEDDPDVVGDEDLFVFNKMLAETDAEIVVNSDDPGGGVRFSRLGARLTTNFQLFVTPCSCAEGNLKVRRIVVMPSGLSRVERVACPAEPPPRPPCRD